MIHCWAPEDAPLKVKLISIGLSLEANGIPLRCPCGSHWVSLGHPLYSHTIIPLSHPSHTPLIPLSYFFIPLPYPSHTLLIPLSYFSHTSLIPLSYPSHWFPCLDSLRQRFTQGCTTPMVPWEGHPMVDPYCVAGVLVCVPP